MGKGDILFITFPFTDLTGSKLRPTVVLNIPIGLETFHGERNTNFPPAQNRKSAN